MDQHSSNNKLKSTNTNDTYQSVFLPLFQRAENQIKALIVYYFYNLKSKTELRLKINNIIREVEKKIPKDLNDKFSYINGLARKSNLMIQKYYENALHTFNITAGLIMANFPRERTMPRIDTPRQLVELITTHKSDLKLNMWSEAKASVRVLNYPKQIKTFIEKVSNESITTSETDKKPISLWQKAELDIRYKNQMEMVDSIKNRGVEYAWISSHDCSKRCEKWQGKLVSLNQHSRYSGFRVGKMNNEWVYSLTDIMAQTDKYGYHNNIINGFNCRHYLIEYHEGEKPVADYSKEDIKKQRAVENRIRSMEREIRLLKTKEINYNKINDKKNSLLVHNERISKIAQYKAFCKDNGYAWYEYRIQ